MFAVQLRASMEPDHDTIPDAAPLGRTRIIRVRRPELEDPRRGEPTTRSLHRPGTSVTEREAIAPASLARLRVREAIVKAQRSDFDPPSPA